MEEVIDRKTGRSLFFPHKKDSTFVHGKVYRRQFLLDNRIVWHPDVKCHEDSGYNCLALKVAKDVKYCQVPLYLWKWREGSICKKDPLYVPKTYTRMIYSNGWLVRDFLDRDMVEEAKYYTALLVYGTYYTRPRAWRMRSTQSLGNVNCGRIICDHHCPRSVNKMVCMMSQISIPVTCCSS